MKKNSTRKQGKNIFSRIFSFLLMASSIVFLSLLFYINLLPNKYFLIILSIILIFNILNIFLVNLKKLKKRIKKFIYIFMLLGILIMSIASFYIGKTLSVLSSNVETNYKLVNYSLVVLKDSNYNDLDNLKNETIGYFENSVAVSEALEDLKESIKVTVEKYNMSNALIHDLLNNKIDAILIENSMVDIMKEESSEFENSTKVIYNFSIKIEAETTLKEVDVSKESFAIYISGIDTFGEISSVSRSDVNMVALINPKINQILLISIPRDYYVQLHGTTGNKDKLTHAGIYGIDMSIKTIEDLLDININYYVKANFSSVIGIVDALGGLDVYSAYSFTSGNGFVFKKGLNRVNGEQALEFVRTRKAFVDGDRQRGKNQQALIEAMVRKVSDKTVITKYNSLLNAVDGKYQTNLSMKKITTLLKIQISEMKPWVITSYSLQGKDAMDYTYTYNQLLYVMKPNEDSIKEAKNLIDKVISDEQLETSYEEVDGPSNTVIQVEVNNPEPEVNDIPNLDEEQNNEENSDELDSNDESNNEEDSSTQNKNESDTDDKKDEEKNEENEDSKDPSLDEGNSNEDSNSNLDDVVSNLEMSDIDNLEN